MAVFSLLYCSKGEILPRDRESDGCTYEKTNIRTTERPFFPNKARVDSETSF